MFLYLIVIAWLYVAVLMAAAVAIDDQGSVFRAILTFFLYGLMPIALVVYLMSGKLRRKARAQREAQAQAALANASDPPRTEALSESMAPDAGPHASGAAPAGLVAPVRKEP